MKGKALISIIIIFLLLTVTFYFVSTNFPDFKFSVLMGGNIIMAILSISSYLIVFKQLNNKPQAFIRGVTGATFLKLMVCMIAIVTYAMVDKAHIYKPVIFVLFGIYAIYTTIETLQLFKLAKQKS